MSVRIAPFREQYVGKVFTDKHGFDFEVTEYNGRSEVHIRYLDGTGYEAVKILQNVRAGNIRNPYSPLAYGVGYLGEGIHPTRADGKGSPEFIRWKSVLSRCYHEPYQELNPSYIGCTVDTKWHNFQNFAEWIKTNKYYREDFAIDKDIIARGNKVYSEDFCCFVPQVINSALRENCSGSNKDVDIPIGVRRKGARYESHISIYGEGRFLGSNKDPDVLFEIYKKTKEDYIKDLALKYKEHIDPRAYESLMTWEISKYVK